MKGEGITGQLQHTTSVSNRIPRWQDLALAIMVLSGDRSVNTYAYPRRDLIPRPVMWNPELHALVAMPIPAGLINNNKTLTPIIVIK
jgi:hypothetical protein